MFKIFSWNANLPVMKRLEAVSGQPDMLSAGLVAARS